MLVLIFFSFSDSILKLGKSWSLELDGCTQYPCPKCPKIYRGKYTLARHLKLECGKQPTNRCEMCGQMFVHRHRLLSHIRSQHLNTFVGKL